MNDPHVVALIYKVLHDESVEYKNATPFRSESEKFCVVIENGVARFEMKEHFSKENDALEALMPFIRSWELQANLERGPGEFELAFQKAEIVDRRPTPGVVELQSIGIVMTVGTAKITVDRGRYPNPAPHLRVDEDVESMNHRYTNYRRGKETLPAIGYFCLTVLEARGGGSRSAAAQIFGVSSQVLGKLGRLTSEKGGKDARKSDGRISDYTDAERLWVETAIRMLIRRAAEIAFDPDQSLAEITMSELPPL